MTQTHAPLAEALLEAHVKHELAALKGTRLKRFVEKELDALLDHAGRVTLSRLSSPEQVMGVIRRVVVNMELDAGVPELAAEMATRVLNAEAQSRTRLGDIISREQVAGFLEQALTLRHQRERVIGEIMAHPVYQELVSNLVYHGLVNYLYEDNLIAKTFVFQFVNSYISFFYIAYFKPYRLPLFGDAALLDTNTRHMCTIHAHLLLMLRNATAPSADMTTWLRCVATSRSCILRSVWCVAVAANKASCGCDAASSNIKAHGPRQRP